MNLDERYSRRRVSLLLRHSPRTRNYLFSVEPGTLYKPRRDIYRTRFLQRALRRTRFLVVYETEDGGGGAVVARTINSGSMVIAFGYSIFAGALIRCKRVSAAMTPISRSGCRMVVSPGF